ncbi:aminoglycoside phosphotransferase family protein [Myceligenerans salitolerans]|uniref:Aminoglycoside phosphotransferase family protein n=1 Tax=Myceligenerans salitolerans TaxID=1230528 RepID=A0ABS3ICN4_9MICO|nr:aminoglycoside phosphotransferase family protein [Myceligenerans salitolerans]MBO0610703.1 aminoglycoside phosphotransferase family protein [Myceligenerans salitolerans]
MSTSPHEADLRTNVAEHVHTPERTRPIAEAAARMAGLDPQGVVLIRHQTNGVYRLTSAPVVIKVAPPGEDHLGEVVALVSWLQDHAVPTVALWGDPAYQPLEIGGRAVTLWHYLPQERPVHAADVAEPLLALHDAPLPPFPLPPLDAFGEIQNSIASSPLLTDQDRSMLRDLSAQLAHDEPLQASGSAPGLIHGDAQHRNTLLDPAGGAVLSDWDSAVIAPREWDLATIEVHCRRFNHPPEEYEEFCRRYGRDIREWSGYEWLRDVRELRMITTNARKSPPGSPAAAEVRRRLDSLRKGETSIWNIL